VETPSFIQRLIRSVVGSNDRASPDRRARNAIAFCHALLSERGEVSEAALAREAMSAYRELPEAGRALFFDSLASEFSPDTDALVAAFNRYREQPTPLNLVALQRAVEPPRQEMLRRLNTAPGATATLVTMRSHLLEGLKVHPEWQAIDADLIHLFDAWFNRGFVTLRRIDWRTSALVLEKLARYEAVHAVAGWRDLHRRLEADRRCFAFFHPALPDEPLIFIEVALTRGMSNTVQPLLDLSAPVLDPQTADTAVFYSITNCQQGLRGIHFGNLLIKQVAQQLGQEFPRLKNFATLSPVPGFRAWLGTIGKDLSGLEGGRAISDALSRLDEPNWHKNERLAQQMQNALVPLCAYYLIHVRHDGEAMDSVARFHLGNGASLERINWLADTSKRGLQQSAGLMVNYLYRLEDVEENHEIYVKEHRVAASRQVSKLARECPLSEHAAKKKAEA
jgi:malonyl-CoA decarboxylase